MGEGGCCFWARIQGLAYPQQRPVITGVHHRFFYLNGGLDTIFCLISWMAPSTHGRKGWREETGFRFRVEHCYWITHGAHPNHQPQYQSEDIVEKKDERASDSYCIALRGSTQMGYRIGTGVSSVSYGITSWIQFTAVVLCKFVLVTSDMNLDTSVACHTSFPWPLDYSLL